MSETEKATETLGCDLNCEIPAGFEMIALPERPRHAWTDVVVCPNCGVAFLMHKKGEAPPRTASA